jgi:hypothetical protein
MLAKPAVQLVFGKSFLPAVTPFIWLMPGSFLLGVEIVIVQYLNSLGFPKIIAYCWLLASNGVEHRNQFLGHSGLWDHLGCDRVDSFVFSDFRACSCCGL